MVRLKKEGLHPDWVSVSRNLFWGRLSALPHKKNFYALWDGRPARPENGARSEREELAEVCGRDYLRLPAALALAALAAFLAAFSAAIASNRACSFSSAILSK